MNYKKYIYCVFLVISISFHLIYMQALAHNVENNKQSSMIETIGRNIESSGTCKKNQNFAWCIPPDYNKEYGPWEYRGLRNLTLPWYYYLGYYIFDVQEVNDKKQTVTLDMYFKIKWFEPRIKINASSSSWSKKASMVDGEYFYPILLDYMMHFWIPDTEIYSLELYQPQNVLRPTANFRINKNWLLRYQARVKLILSCQMNFEDYPFDSQHCHFRQGSFYNHQDVVNCTTEVSHDNEQQRNLQYMMDIHPEYHLYKWGDTFWPACGFKMELKRKTTQIFFQVYLTSTLLVSVSWVSFIIDPSIVPGRMGLLVTVFLVLINIFISVKRDAPTSSGFLNAVDVFLVVCIGEVFAAILEYALVLYVVLQHKVQIVVPNTDKNQEYPESSHRNVHGNKYGARRCIPRTRRMKKYKESSEKKRRNLFDRISLCLYPISFIAFIGMYLYVYLR